MTRTIHGIVRGNKTIELVEEIGIADGQEVEVHLQITTLPRKTGEGLQRCAGALAADWSEEDDRILQEIYQDRKRDTRREIPE